jgi:site-specific recombinase XerD
MPVIDTEAYLEHWRIHLEAANRSAGTIKSYELAVRQLSDFIDNDIPVDQVSRRNVEEYIGHVLDTRASATAAQRYRSLQQWFRWLADTAEVIDQSPMAKMQPPKIQEAPVPVLTNDEIKALLATTKGTGFAERRDRAIILTLLDTGIRLGELVGLRLEHVDLKLGVILVHGKGDRWRTAPIGRQTTLALSRYLMKRPSHPEAGHTDLVWLGGRGPLRATGVHQMLNRRATEAGIGRIHAHQFRHTFAHQWKAAGGHDDALQQIGGWRSRQMLTRYGASAAAERAQAEHRDLSPADRLSL